MNNEVSNNRFERMLKRVLKPLVKFLLKHGITFTALQDALKSLYVEVSIESGKLETKRMTDSRISLLTGIHRKEVKRLRECLEHGETVPLGERQASLGAAVMAKWLSSPDYVEDTGHPCEIPKTGAAPSFEALVYSVSKDKHFRSLLDDWLAQEIVTLEDNFLTLQQQGLVPSEDEVEKLFFAGKNLGAHIETVTQNLQPDSTPMFERAVFYRGLSQTSVLEIEQEAKRRNLETLTKINEMAEKAKQSLPAGKDSNDEHNTSGFHLGIYFLRETQKLSTQSSKITEITDSSTDGGLK